jgi:hypothetical protein
MEETKRQMADEAIRQTKNVLEYTHGNDVYNSMALSVMIASALFHLGVCSFVVDYALTQKPLRKTVSALVLAMMISSLLTLTFIWVRWQAFFYIAVMLFGISLPILAFTYRPASKESLRSLTIIGALGILISIVGLIFAIIKILKLMKFTDERGVPIGVTIPKPIIPSIGSDPEGYRAYLINSLTPQSELYNKQSVYYPDYSHQEDLPKDSKPANQASNSIGLLWDKAQNEVASGLNPRWI